MRVAIVTNFFPPIQTGSCFWAMNLAQAHLKAGDDVIVVTVGTSTKVETQVMAGLTVYRLPSVWRIPKTGFFLNFDSFYLINSSRNRDRFANILRDHRIEIVHQSNHLLDAVFLTQTVCANLNLPWVSSVHGAIIHSGNPIYNAIMRGVDHMIIRRAMDACSAIIALDAEMERYINRRYRPRRSKIIPLCCMDADSFARLPRARPEGHFPKEENPSLSIASVGHVTANRDRTELIRAIASLSNSGIDAHLDVIGQILTQAPVQLSQQLAVADRVEFHRELPHNDLLDRLARAHAEAHLFFMPGLGCATQEAMAVGLPTICNGYEGIYGDLPLRQGENIYFADPDNPDEVATILVELAQQPELRKKVGLNARQLIGEHLIWEVVIERFRELYAEVI